MNGISAMVRDVRKGTINASEILPALAIGAAERVRLIGQAMGWTGAVCILVAVFGTAILVLAK